MIPFFINDVPIECINRAAIVYQVPATAIVSVLKVEGGRNGIAHHNKDGTYDYGAMQINSRWLAKIASYGYTKHDIQFNPCINVAVGAWILRQNIIAGTNFWTSIGNYHSHTPALNLQYNLKVHSYYNWLAEALRTKLDNIGIRQ